MSVERLPFGSKAAAGRAHRFYTCPEGSEAASEKTPYGTRGAGIQGSMSGYSYHRLASSDQPHARALMALFADAFADAPTYLQKAPSDAYLAGLLAKPHVVVLVARAGDVVVGGLVAYQLEKLEQARSELYIYDLAVAQEHRRRGVATTLIRRLGDIARELGAWVMFVQADPGDNPAMRLYASLGTREDVHHFDIAVPSQGGSG